MMNIEYDAILEQRFDFIAHDDHMQCFNDKVTKELLCWLKK